MDTIMVFSRIIGIVLLTWL